MLTFEYLCAKIIIDNVYCLNYNRIQKVVL